jgi:hypothetical protein
MTSIILTTTVYGAWTGAAGDVVSRPDSEAMDLIAGGYAVLNEPGATFLLASDNPLDYLAVEPAPE